MAAIQLSVDKILQIQLAAKSLIKRATSPHHIQTKVSPRFGTGLNLKAYEPQILNIPLKHGLINLLNLKLQNFKIPRR